MATFRTAMAFPMFATVVWLLWVLGQQVGIDGAAALLGLILAVAFAAWVFSATRSRASARRRSASARPRSSSLRPSARGRCCRRRPASRSAARRQRNRSRWQPWSPDALARARAAAGRSSSISPRRGA
jgi:thiol:disulfide interchange protein DsbD